MILDGKPAVYRLERKRVKNMNLRVCADGGIHVSAAPYVPAESVDAFVVSRERWIAKARKRRGEEAARGASQKKYEEGERFRILGKDRTLHIQKGAAEEVFLEGDRLVAAVKEKTDPRRIEMMTERYLAQICGEILTEKTEKYLPCLEPYGVKMPKLRFRRMKTRWGSCTPQKGRVTLNLRLLEVPEDALEYVVLHELCHFVHPNHSGEFYELVSRWMPDWKERKKRLSV